MDIYLVELLETIRFLVKFFVFSVSILTCSVFLYFFYIRRIKNGFLIGIISLYLILTLPIIIIIGFGPLAALVVALVLWVVNFFAILQLPTRKEDELLRENITP